jgi:hypothetical protein
MEDEGPAVKVTPVVAMSMVDEDVVDVPEEVVDVEGAVPEVALSRAQVLFPWQV